MQGRIRTFKPSLFQDERLWDLGVSSGMPMLQVFEGLWSYSDREGRFEWKPLVLRGLITPFWDGDFTRALLLLEEAGFIRSYAAKGKLYGYVPGFPDHQKINGKEGASRLPQPPPDPRDDDASFTREHHVNDVTPPDFGTSEKNQQVARESDARSTREPHVAHATSLPFPSSSLSSDARRNATAAEVFDVAHPDFDEPLNARPSEPMSAPQVPVVEETALQRAARRLLHGGGQAQTERFERGPAERWPEVERLTKLDCELRGSHDKPRTESDKRVQRILERYAEGFTPDELEDVVRRARADEFWGNQGLHTVLKEPANFDVIGRPKLRNGGDDNPRSSGVPIVLSAAEAAKWR